MAMQRTVYRDEEEIMNRATELAQDQGISRNEFICRAVRAEIKRIDDAKLAEELRQGYIANNAYRSGRRSV